MAIETWLPIGYKLPDGAVTGTAVYSGAEWQVVLTNGGGRALLANDSIASRWFDAGLIVPGLIESFDYGSERLWAISSRSSQTLSPVADAESPQSKVDALSFALALAATREIDAASPLQDAIYVEKISRLLPTYAISSSVDDDVVLGYWLTGGARVSVRSFRRIGQMTGLGDDALLEVVEAAGIDVADSVPIGISRKSPQRDQGQLAVDAERESPSKDAPSTQRTFELPGRPELASFFNEHVVDIVQNRDRYRALGIDFPAAIVLHGPPGCGKTFAVERLIDFLGWPSFQIDASSVASPYIHETSKKVAQVFEKAMENSPSVLVIDEMEAFLADREAGLGHHRVEEVAEFLRRIPEAAKNGVLIIAMTNRVEMIDPAILRRGRFDHIVKVDYASEGEILSLLDKLLSTLPTEDDVDVRPFAVELAGRPLSDVAFVVREGARIAARSGRESLNQASLMTAMRTAPSRKHHTPEPRRVGFI